MGKVIFINRYFYPDHSATSQLLSDLTFELAQDNFDIHVITSRQTYEDSSQKLPAFEIINGVNIRRIYTSQFGRHNLLGRALDYLTFHLSASWRLFKDVKSGDLIVAKTDPPLISTTSAFIAQIRGAKLINWLQDIFPDIAVALNVKGASIVNPLLIHLRNYSLRRAIKNVVLADKMSDRLTGQDIPRSSIDVIHNWSDGELIAPIPRKNNQLRTAWGFDDHFIVGYSGNMGRAHDFKTIIDAAKILKHDKNISFLFIGGGAKRDYLEKRVKEHQLDNIHFMPYQDRNKLSLSLCLPDVHLISLLHNLEGLIVPSKFYGIAAAGRPTLYIGASDGAIPKILSENNCGITVNIGDPRKLAAQIELLSKDPGMTQKMGKNARSAFDRLFDKQVAISKWKCTINNAMGSDQKDNISDTLSCDHTKP